MIQSKDFLYGNISIPESCNLLHVFFSYRSQVWFDYISMTYILKYGSKVIIPLCPTLVFQSFQKKIFFFFKIFKKKETFGNFEKDFFFFNFEKPNVGHK